jgi:geranylgeranyl reductase family protein
MLEPTDVWDVAVIGAGPAGASAALAAASKGKRVIILERFSIPRYKTCGGGLIGASVKMLPKSSPAPIRASAASFTFSVRGQFERTRTSKVPIIRLVQRDEFDAYLVNAAIAANAEIRQNVAVTRLTQENDVVRITTRDHGDFYARIVVGADGSAGRSSAYVGVVCDEVDLGLEIELAIPQELSPAWANRILIDWGSIPGSYGWIFSKGDALSVGVIAKRGNADLARAYLKDLLSRHHLDHIKPSISSGHLTRCRTEDSPLYRGRVLVAGDAAGLVEPWTREGISFALRSGTAAGHAAAAAAEAASEAELTAAMTAYTADISSTMGYEMRTGRAFLRAFTRHPRVFHIAIIRLPQAWDIFVRLVSGETTFAIIGKQRTMRLILALLGSHGRER